MSAERRAALVRATGWTGVALPGWLFVAWLLGLLPLATATWGLALGCELALAWIQGADYPPLGPWSWLSDAHSTAAFERTTEAVKWLRSRVPWDGFGCAAVLAGPLAIVVILTTTEWAPKLGTITMISAATAEVCGTVFRARGGRFTIRHKRENGDTEDGDP